MVKRYSLHKDSEEASYTVSHCNRTRIVDSLAIFGLKWVFPDTVTLSEGGKPSGRRKGKESCFAWFFYVYFGASGKIVIEGYSIRKRCQIKD